MKLSVSKTGNYLKIMRRYAIDIFEFATIFLLLKERKSLSCFKGKCIVRSCTDGIALNCAWACRFLSRCGSGPMAYRYFAELAEKIVIAWIYWISSKFRSPCKGGSAQSTRCTRILISHKKERKRKKRGNKKKSIRRKVRVAWFNLFSDKAGVIKSGKGVSIHFKGTNFEH